MTGRHLRHTLGAAALASVLFAAGACSKEIDTAKPEQAIAREVKRAYGITAADVTCPDSLKAKKGSTFQCIVVLSGDRLTVDVTQTDDKGALTFKPAQALITEKTVVAAIKRQYNASSVDCGKRTYWVSRPGRTIRCRARDAVGGNAVVVVTVNDTQGNIELDLAQ
jgi:hypothetical protein